MGYAEFDVFLIYFGTSTFDKIAKDTKMKLETMIGVIGGTCGLLTGFSILSGVEILYYATLFLVSLISSKVKRVSTYKSLSHPNIAEGAEGSKSQPTTKHRNPTFHQPGRCPL